MLTIVGCKISYISIQSSRDRTARNRVFTGSREPVQPGFPLAKSSSHPFLRMQPLLPSPYQWALQPSQPMAHMPHMAPSTWSTLFWLSCKYWSRIENLSWFAFILFVQVSWSTTYCHVSYSTLVIKQKLPGIYVQPSYKSALSKEPTFELSSISVLYLHCSNASDLSELYTF